MRRSLPKSQHRSSHTKVTKVSENEETLRDFSFLTSNYDINWKHVPVILGTPVLALLGILTTKLIRETLIWSIVFYFLTGFGITAGYHRLWSHRTFVANLPLQIFLLVCSTASIQGSVIWWVSGHRAHHRYTDTNKDPYSVHRGLLWSHIGWLLVIEHDLPVGQVDVSDLTKDPLLVWQDKNFDWFSPLCAFVLPTVVAGLGWGDWRGGFVYAAVARLVFVHHATFSVNSLAHYLGDRPYDNKSAGDSTITAFATLGEGHHCFHHAYPTDYRNGIRWYQYDPTKWTIALYGFLGLATNLNTFDDNEINKGMIQTSQQRLDEWHKKVNWGPSIHDLPVIDMEQFHEACRMGKSYILISGIIYDIELWIPQHPGGEKWLRSAISKDATAMFNGGVYNHSRVARNLLDSKRVAILRGGMEVKIWSDRIDEDGASSSDLDPLSSSDNE